MSKTKPKFKTSVGGQALIEGVMMRGPKGTAISIRIPDGSIDTEYKNFSLLSDKAKFLKWPFIRGVVNFIDSMKIGYSSLMESAEKSGFEEEEENEEEMSKFETWMDEHLGEKLFSIIMVIATILGFALAFGLFYWLPTASVNGINSLVGGTLGNWRPLIEGIMRIVIFVLYIVIVSRTPDIKRVFMYHGAEHKTIFCYENGLDLTVENVRKQSRFHPRCGTSFMFVMLILGVIVSVILSAAFPGLRDQTALWILSKVLTVPLIVSLGYEFIRYAGRHDNFLIRALSAPGLWMQRITTREPTDDMIEVALASFIAVITDDRTDDEIA